MDLNPSVPGKRLYHCNFNSGFLITSLIGPFRCPFPFPQRPCSRSMFRGLVFSRSQFQDFLSVTRTSYYSPMPITPPVWYVKSHYIYYRVWNRLNKNFLMTSTNTSHLTCPSPKLRLSESSGELIYSSLDHIPPSSPLLLYVSKSYITSRYSLERLPKPTPSISLPSFFTSYPKTELVDPPTTTISTYLQPSHPEDRNPSSPSRCTDLFRKGPGTKEISSLWRWRVKVL